MYEQAIENRKSEAINIAKDLCYGKDVIKQIRAATTANEIDLIMRSARKNMKD